MTSRWIRISFVEKLLDPDPYYHQNLVVFSLVHVRPFQPSSEFRENLPGSENNWSDHRDTILVHFQLAHRYEMCFCAALSIA